MSETTGGNSGGSGGAGGAGGAGGSQVENLVIGFQTTGAEETASAGNKVADAVIRVGTATVRSITDLGALSKAMDENAQWTEKSRKNLDDFTKSILDATQAEAAAQAVAQARIEQGTAYLAKLNEMVKTYNMTTGEVQRFRAEQLGVSNDAEGFIARMEAMAEATRKFGVAIKDTTDVGKVQAQWEEANATALNAQRIRAAEDQRKLEESSSTALNAQRIRETNERIQLEESASASLNAQRIRDKNAQMQLEESATTALNAQRNRALAENAAAEKAALEEQEKSQTIFQAFKRRTMAENRAEAMRILVQQEKDAEALAEKQAIEEIKWGQMSLKARIAQLQELKAYVDKGISQPTIDKTFTKTAQNDLGKLDELIKQYNETLGAHGKKLGEAGEQASVWGKILGNNRIRTEGLVLAHEALQGRFTRLGGSLGVMVEYLSAANIKLGAMAAYALGGVAAVAALGYEMYKASEQTSKLADALNRTNGYSGETRSSLEQLAHTVGSLHGSYTSAYEAVEKLTASGKFTGDQIRMITNSAVELEHTMGTDVNTTIKEFETLAVKGTSNATKGTFQVAKALEALDEKYHFVNSSLMEEIVNLEKEGKEREAQEAAVRAYVAELGRAADESEKYTTMMQLGWRGLKSVVNEIRQGFVDMFKGQDLARQKAELLASMAHNSDGSLKTDTTFDPLQAYKLRQLKDLDDQIKAEEEAAKKKEDIAAKRSAADRVIVMRAIEDRTLLKKSGSELENALEKNAEQMKILAADNPAYFDDPKNVQKESDRVLAIIKAHSQKVKAAKNDGRKQELLNDLAEDQQAYKTAEEAAAQDIKLLKEWADAKIITRQTEADSIQAAYNRQLTALAESEKAQLATLRAYKPANDVDAKEKIKRINDVTRAYELQKQQIMDLREKAGEDVVTKAVKEVKQVDSKELTDLDNKIKAQEKYNAEIGKTAEQKKLADKQIEDGVLMQERLDLAIEQAKASDKDLGDVERAVAEQRVKDLEEAIGKRERYNKLLADAATLEKQAAVDKQWKEMNKKIGDDLAEAIIDGGGKGWRKLINDMKLAFAKLILQPIIAPISASITSYLYPNATQAGGLAGVSGGAEGSSPLGSLVSAAQTASKLYKAATDGFASIGSTIGQGVSWVGRQIGSEGMTQFGGGMQGFGADGSLGAMGQYGQMASQGIGYAAGAIGGHYVGNMIAGDYSMNHGQAVTNIASVVGTAIAGPIGGIIGGAIGGLANRMFGMGSKELRDQGITGTLSDSGAIGQSYQSFHQKGGWFRSDKDWTEKKALDNDTLAILGNGFKDLKDESLALAKSLGVSDNALEGYTKKFDIKFTNDAEKNKQAVTEFFTGVGNEIATRLVPTLSAFARAGETAADTLQRLSGEFDVTNQAAKLMGTTAAHMFGSDDVNSTAARERLINYSGGASNVVSQAQFFQQNFLTEQERLAPVAASLDTALKSLGLSTIPQTREEFKKLVQDLVKSGAVASEAGAKEYASLMGLADAFAQVHPASTDLAMTLEKAQGNLTNAYQNQVSAITQANEKMSTFSKTLRSLNVSTLMGDLSPLTPEQKYAQAKADFDRISKSAQSGNEDAQSEFSNAYQTFLSASRTVNASGSNYQADFQYAQRVAEQLAQYADTQADSGQKQLDLLKKQVDGLIDINDSVLTVAEGIQQVIKAMDPKGEGGIQNLYESMLGHAADKDTVKYWMDRMATGTTLEQIAQQLSRTNEFQSTITQSNGPSALSAAATAFDSAPMLTVLNALKDSLDALRKEAAQQTGDQIATQAETAQTTTDTIEAAIDKVASLTKTRVQPL